MMVRSWVVAAISLGGLVAWNPVTTAGARQYRLELKTTVVQDLTVAGQGEQTQDFTTTAYVTVSATDSAGGQVITMVLDSLLPGEGSPIPDSAAKAASGQRWHGFRSGTGKVGDLKLEGDSPVAAAVEPALIDLLPPMRPGTPEGQVWTDTTDTDNNGISVRTVTNFQTTSDTFKGAKVIRLAGAFSSAMTGQQQSPQGLLNLEGTGTGTNTWLVGADGYSLTATHSANQKISITVPTLPEPIPVTVTTEGTATLVQ
jgi:hypothetical protein